MPLANRLHLMLDAISNLAPFVDRGPGLSEGILPIRLFNDFVGFERAIAVFNRREASLNVSTSTGLEFVFRHNTAKYGPDDHRDASTSGCLLLHLKPDAVSSQATSVLTAFFGRRGNTAFIALVSLTFTGRLRTHQQRYRCWSSYWCPSPWKRRRSWSDESLVAESTA